MTGINFDSDGFLLGDRRLKQLSENIQEKKDDIKDILQVLLGGVKNAIEAEGEKLRNTITKTAIDANEHENLVSIASFTTSQSCPISKHTAIDAEEVSKPLPRKTIPAITKNGAQEILLKDQKYKQSRIPYVSDVVVQDAESEQSNGPSLKSLDELKTKENQYAVINQLKEKFNKMNSEGSDISGYSPTVDALLELKQAISPVTQVFTKMSARAISLFTGRLKKQRNDEVLPEEQAKANKQGELNDRERNRLLRRMLDALLRRNNDGGDGPDIGIGFGGDRGGKGKGKGKGGKGGRFKRLGKLAKGIPYLGAALTALSLSDWNEQSITEKGGTVGSLAGGAIGGTIGLLGGPIGVVVGSVIGSWAGEKLGGIVAPVIEPYFRNWTNSLIKADVPGMIKASWSNLTDSIKKLLNVTPIGGAVKTAKTVATGVSNAISTVKNTVTQAWGDTFGDKDSRSASGKYAPLLNEIASGEAKGGAFGTKGYDAIYQGAQIKPPKPISQMTVGEVKAYQQQLVDAGAKSTAVGRYQFIRNQGAFGKMAAQAGLKDTDIFDSAAQDRLAIHYLGGEKQLNQWLKTGNYAALTNKTAQQFASMKNTRGVGNYDNDGLNKARHGGIDVIRKVGDEILMNQQTPAPQASIIPYVNKKPKQTSAVNVKGAEKRPRIKLPQSPELEKVSSNKKDTVVIPQYSDSFIAQDVSNRGLAHTFSGGLGYRGVQG